jgi:prepilin-type N-terminal cleavage/methylation domain
MDGKMAIIPKKCMTGSTRNRQAGFTLLEVMFAMGIMATAILGAMMAVYGSHRQTQLTAMEITARNSIRGQIEEVMSVAAEHGKEIGHVAQGILSYYADNDVARLQVPGPGGVDTDKVFIDDGNLVCLFVIPQVAEAPRDVAGGGAGVRRMVPNYRAVGRMTMYLDETKVGPDPDAVAHMDQVRDEDKIWSDLKREADGGKVQKTGFDMNGDGILETGLGNKGINYINRLFWNQDDEINVDAIWRDKKNW